MDKAYYYNKKKLLVGLAMLLVALLNIAKVISHLGAFLVIFILALVFNRRASYSIDFSLLFVFLCFLFFLET